MLRNQLCDLFSSVMLFMYIPVAAAGFIIYGDNVEPNIIQSLPNGWIRITTEILIVMHLVFAFIIALNPFSLLMEEICHVPHSE